MFSYIQCFLTYTTKMHYFGEGVNPLVARSDQILTHVTKPVPAPNLDQSPQSMGISPYYPSTPRGGERRVGAPSLVGASWRGRSDQPVVTTFRRARYARTFYAEIVVKVASGLSRSWPWAVRDLSG